MALETDFVKGGLVYDQRMKKQCDTYYIIQKVTSKMKRQQR